MSASASRALTRRASAATTKKRTSFEVWALDSEGRAVDRLIGPVARGIAMRAASAIFEDAPEGSVRIEVRDTTTGTAIAHMGEAGPPTLPGAVVGEVLGMIAAVHRELAPVHGRGARAEVADGAVARAIRERVAASPAARQVAEAIMDRLGDRLREILGPMKGRARHGGHE